MTEYTIERQVGNTIKMTKHNLFLEEVDDMLTIEYWEDRLEKLQQEFIIAYKTSENGKILYTIFCNTNRKGSILR